MTEEASEDPEQASGQASSEQAIVPLRTIAREWTRIGCIGFGGPPAHIALLRRMCVEERHWIAAGEFEDGVAATNLLPGPASTQLAIFCAWRLRGTAGAAIGGACFIIPGLVLILGLSALFLANHPPIGILGAAAGAGAAVPAVALRAAAGFVPASWRRIGNGAGDHERWIAYALVGCVVTAAAGPYLVLAILACGLAEIALRHARPPGLPAVVPGVVAHAIVGGGALVALSWVAFKVGALSYGGGFVIVPLMQHDAVTTYHWMSGAQFLNAVALGQVTPGPVVQTVAVIGYAAHGLEGGLLAAVIAFSPSFLFVLYGGPRFDSIRRNARVQTFLSGAGPTVVGAIAGSAIPLGLSFRDPWQIIVLGGALLGLFVLRRGVVEVLVICGVLGVAVALSGVKV